MARVGTLLALALTAVAGAAGCAASGMREVALLDGNGQTLRARFDGDSACVRVLALASPS
jgi:hypothetical protein